MSRDDHDCKRDWRDPNKCEYCGREMLPTEGGKFETATREVKEKSGSATESNKENSEITWESIKSLMKELKEIRLFAPPPTSVFYGALRIMKNDLLPPTTIILSSDLMQIFRILKDKEEDERNERSTE